VGRLEKAYGGPALSSCCPQYLHTKPVGNLLWPKMTVGMDID
jgi:hypothetical protein